MSAFIPALFVLISARVWAATMHQAPWESGERVLKANRHQNSRVYDYYVQKGYQTCQHHPQVGWLHLHRRVSVGECAEYVWCHRAMWLVILLRPLKGG